MKVFLLILIAFLPDNAKAQSDTSFFAGVPNSSAFAIYRSVTSCYGNDIEFITSPPVYYIICGFQKCSNPTGMTTHYYRIIHNGKPFYISNDDLKTTDDVKKKLESMDEFQKAAYYSRAMAADSILTIHDRIKFLEAMKTAKITGLIITNWSYSDESEHTNGTSLEFNIYNGSKKTIKYIWFNVTGYNAVGDKVIDPRRKTSLVSVKGVGPVKYEEDGSWEFDYAWFTDLVETVKINSVKVQYMDGTFKTYPYSKSLVLNKILYTKFLANSDQ